MTRFTLVTSVRVSSSRILLSHRVELKQGSKLRSKKNWKALFQGKKLNWSNDAILRLYKKSSNMTRVVWAGDSKTSLRIKIGPRQQKL